VLITAYAFAYVLVNLLHAESEKNQKIEAMLNQRVGIPPDMFLFAYI